MAVVTSQSDLFAANAYGDNGVDPARARGRPIVIQGTVTNAADDSNLSKYKLVDLPADCILLSDTQFKVDGWGFAQVVIGTLDDTDAVLDVARAAATTQSPVTKFAAAWHGKPLWQALGLAARPASNVITLWAHAEANATGAGSMLFEFHYNYR